MLMRTRAALAVAATGVAVLATACSSSSPEPQPSTETSDEAWPTATSTATAMPPPVNPDGLSGNEIITQARDALHVASSYRVEGTIGGGTGQVTIDLIYAGGDRHGTWELGSSSAEVIQIDGTTYVQGNQAYWEGILYSEAAASLVGVWVELDGPYGMIAGTLIPDIETLLAPAGVLEPGEETTINGQSAVKLTDGTTTVAVAIQGPPYPLRITADDGTRLDLSDFGEPVTIKAPTGEVRSLSEETGG